MPLFLVNPARKRYKGLTSFVLYNSLTMQASLVAAYPMDTRSPDLLAFDQEFPVRR